MFATLRKKYGPFPERFFGEPRNGYYNAKKINKKKSLFIFKKVYQCMSGFTALEGLFDYSSQLTILFNCPGGVKFRDAEISKTCLQVPHSETCFATILNDLDQLFCISTSIRFLRLKMLDIFNTIMSTMSVNTEPLDPRCLP